MPAINTNISQIIGNLFRVRFEIQETGGAAVAQAYQLRYSKNGAGYAQVTTSTDVRPAASAQFTDGAATTDVLPNGTGTFVAGIGDEGDAVTPSISLGASGHTEIEFSLVLAGLAAAGDTFDLRVYTNAGVALNTYTNTARVTAASAVTALPFLTMPPLGH